MKETFYFSHDYHARNDIKLSSMTMKQLGIFWCLVEMLYESGGYLDMSLCGRIAVALRTECEEIESVLNDFDLFQNDGHRFWSESVLRRLEARRKKSEMAKFSASKRWGNANALPTHSERYAIKERKGKENKDTEQSSSSKKNPIYEIATYYQSITGKNGKANRYFRDASELMGLVKQTPDCATPEKALKEVLSRIEIAKWHYEQIKITDWGLGKVVENWDKILKEWYPAKKSNQALYDRADD